MRTLVQPLNFFIFTVQALAKHATLALAVLLREPGGARALLGQQAGADAPDPALLAALVDALCARVLDDGTKEALLLAALDVSVTRSGCTQEALLLAALDAPRRRCCSPPWM